MSNISLTTWWKKLQNDLKALNQRFPEVFSQHKAFCAAVKMASIGVQLEGASIFSLYSVASDLKTESINLGNPICSLQKEIEYLPIIKSSSDVIFALIYYNHLLLFQNVKSTESMIQNGGFGQPGILDRMPIIAQLAITLKKNIDTYLSSTDNFNALKHAYPQYNTTFNSSQAQFDILEMLATGVIKTPQVNAAVQPISDNTFENSLGLMLMRSLEDCTSQASSNSVALTNVMETLENVQACAQFRTLVQSSSTELASNNTADLLKELDQSNIPELQEQIQETQLYVAILNKTSKRQRSDISSIHQTPVLQSEKNIFFHLYKTFLSISRAEDQRNILIIQRKAAKLLQQQLSNFNAHSVTFHIENLDSHTPESLNLIHHKLCLLKEIEAMEDNLVDYISQSNQPTFQFLHYLYIAIYHSNWTFLKNYFIPGEWQCEYEAENLLTILTNLKNELNTNQETEPASIQSTLESSKQKSKIHIDLISEFSIFTSTQNKVIRRKQQLQHIILEQTGQGQTPCLN